jgi:hypothetical protein
MKILFVVRLTNTRASYNAMIDCRAAILTDLETVMFMMRNCTRCIWCEFKSQVSGISAFCTLDERHRRFALPLQDNGFSYVAGSCTYKSYIAVDNKELAAIRASMKKHQVLWHLFGTIL